MQTDRIGHHNTSIDTSNVLTDTQFESDLLSYVTLVLPPLPDGRYHSPFHIAAFLFAHKTKK